MLQVREPDLGRTEAELARHGLAAFARRIGTAGRGGRIRIAAGGRVLVDEDRRALHAAWSETTWRMQKLRDEPACADEERDARLDAGRPGTRLAADLRRRIRMSRRHTSRPAGGRAVAILREQGVNSQVEMAAAFDRAGFTAVDVHMTDLIDRGATLDGYQGLVACGGFSYGDVLGAGEGLGEVDPLQPARARPLRGLVRADGPLHARRLQRLPDAGRPRGTHSRCGALAALPPQPVRAVRGPALDG